MLSALPPILDRLLPLIIMEIKKDIHPHRTKYLISRCHPLLDSQKTISLYQVRKNILFSIPCLCNVRLTAGGTLQRFHTASHRSIQQTLHVKIPPSSTLYNFMYCLLVLFVEFIGSICNCIKYSFLYLSCQLFL